MTYLKLLVSKLLNRKFKLNYPYQISQFNSYSPSLIATAKKIKLLIFDVDGVFTDGRLYFNDNGSEFKGFHAHDGFGFMQLHRLPITLAVITGRGGAATKHRIKKQLKVNHAYFGIKNKYKLYKKLLRKFHLSPDNVAFVGDDIPDVHVMKNVGLPIATANATPYIKHIALWITPQSGGMGAVRDVADLFIAVYQNDTGHV